MKHEKFLFIEATAGKKVKLEKHIEGKITPKSISVVNNGPGGNPTVIIGYTPSAKKHSYDIVERTLTGLDKLEAAAAKLEGVVCQDVEYTVAGKYKVTFLVATAIA